MRDLAPNISSLQARVPISNRGPILVIEDNAAVTDMICCILECAGYQAIACTGRKAALAWINRALEGGYSPALILLDVGFPPTNPIDFLSHLRRQFSGEHFTLPAVILLTTCRAFHDEFAAVERVILKPFHVRDLLAEVQNECSSGGSRAFSATPGAALYDISLGVSTGRGTACSPEELY